MGAARRVTTVRGSVGERVPRAILHLVWIDLNADVGESFGRWTLGDDEAMLAVVTSANVACGFHAGDPTTLRAVCAIGAAAGVTIGAQVAYLKPHGALYHATVHHDAQARAVVDAAREYGDLPVLGLPGSALLSQARAADLAAVPECFADRGYTPSGTLVPRDRAGALITDPLQVADRAVRMATDGEVVAADGSLVRVEAASICLHGDTPGAPALARAVRTALLDAGVRLRAFAGAPPTP